MSMSVFVSYSRRDYVTVYAIVRELSNHGVDIWIDQDNLNAGVRWDDKLQHAIENASHILLMMSRNSMESQNVRDEFSFAIGEGKEIIIALIDEVKLPLRLHRFQYIDLRSNYDKAFETLLRHLPASGLALPTGIENGTTLQQSTLLDDVTLQRNDVYKKSQTEDVSIVFPKDQPITSQLRTPFLMLEFEAEDVTSRIWSMKHSNLIIGRGSDCDIKLVNPRISRQHLEIICQENEYFARDMGSSNGTFVNGHDITAKLYKLHDGDAIEIADIVHIRVILTPQKEYDTQKFLHRKT